MRGVGKALISGSFDSQSDVFQQIAEFEETQCVCIHHKTVLLYFTQNIGVIYNHICCTSSKWPLH